MTGSRMRCLRGLEIVARGRQITQVANSTYLVQSQSSDLSYKVQRSMGHWICDCPDFLKRRAACKHIFAVLFLLRLPEVLTSNPITFTISRPTTAPTHLFDGRAELMIQNRPGGDGKEKDSFRTEAVACPHCRSARYVIKRGVRLNKAGIVQRYLCKHCGKKFILKTGFEGMKHTANAITAAMDLYFKGLSLSKVVDHLQQFHNTYVSDTTVHRWVRKYVDLINHRLDRLQPNLSGSWHTDETCLKVGGRNEYMWNMLDSKTRFLIATQVTKRRSATEAEQIVESSILKTGKQPTRWITDGLSSYKKAKKCMGRKSDTVHVSNGRFTQKPNNNLIERFHGTVKERTKVIRGFRNNKAATHFAEGYRIYYNFIRPHKALHGKTPAETAGLRKPRTPNRWLGIIQPAQPNPTTETQ